MWRLSLLLVYVFLDKDHEVCIWLCFHLDMKKLQPKVDYAIFLFDLKLPKKIQWFFNKTLQHLSKGTTKNWKKVFNFFGVMKWKNIIDYVVTFTKSQIPTLKTKKNLMFNFLYWGVQQEDLKITWHKGCNHHILLQTNQ
jgi:hypothetical protein